MQILDASPPRDKVKNMGKFIAVFALACALGLVSTLRAAEEKDALQSKTNWKGHETNTSDTKSRKWPVTVKCLKRAGDKATLNFWTVSNDGRKGVQMEATIDETGKIRAKITKVLPGDDWHETVVGTYWTGTVTDKTLTIKRPGHRGAALTAELTLHEREK